jgi:hypothetical protein
MIEHDQDLAIGETDDSCTLACEQPGTNTVSEGNLVPLTERTKIRLGALALNGIGSPNDPLAIVGSDICLPDFLDDFRSVHDLS